MRIGLVHNYYRQAGGEDATFAVESALLRENGHEVAQYIEDNQRINEMNPVTAAARSIWSRRSSNQLLKMLWKAHYNVVHFHNTFLLISPSAYYACRDAGVPVVQTVQNYRLLCPVATFFREGQLCEDCLGKTPPWPGILHACYHNSRTQTSVVAVMLALHRFLKTWLRCVDIYIAPTEFIRKKHVEGGFPAEKLVVKPNFVHPDPGMRQAQGHFALFVGRLTSEKGVETLLKAWRVLKGIPLKIVGNGPLQNKVEVYLRDPKLEQVENLGQRAHEEVLALMKAARFLVFPSEWYEAFPVTLVEAFACGVPVIVSRLGGMAEIVEDQRMGLHFTPGDAEDLAAKVDWAWTNSEQTEKMGCEGRVEYEVKYTAKRNYEILMQIYRRVIEVRKRR
ncbi:MAG: glycosyltransferase [Candidatus Binatia bacterium]